ncbi:AI-2E family transporter [Bartonella tribocorum]|uniref:Permease protein n=1 Tax=Bartonella tribocorum (strain DSM 28219 / CCUG 45778 / CIP 105476 / IBS 506) TaxID=382640 RepID=A9IVF5_BART1|nr:AI-2E family transporter [Bartonella tribocorum]CAK01702.1 permease protein [Bartonella tribocorum CIP 105476]CDO48948.1 permease protein [Bartonella tribocorum]
MSKISDNHGQSSWKLMKKKVSENTSRDRYKSYTPAYTQLPLPNNMKRQIFFWLGALIFFILFMFIFGSILLPFVAGIVLAYFLNPIVQLLEKFGIRRVFGTVLITLFIVIIFVAALIILIPIISWQIQQFVSDGLPVYMNRIQTFFVEHDFDWIRDYFGSDPNELRSNIKGLLGEGSDFITSLLNSLLKSGKSIVNIVSLFVVAPVVTFYMLLDWPRMVRAIDSLIPRDHLETVRSIFHEMDRAIAGFVRGQGTVCLILGGYYAIGLTIAGLNFGLLIGMFIGLISFIPYIGTMSGLLLSVGIAWVQFYPNNWGGIIVVLALFLIGQFIEGYVLQPKLVGSSVGLHPVWLMFSLFAFSSLFGFTGMLVAVPAAAAVGVLVRFALHTYLSSQMYSRSGNSEPQK